MKEMGNKNLGVLSNYKDLHPIKDAIWSKAPINCYFEVKVSRGED